MAESSPRHDRLHLNGRVVLVTGAGSGLGEAFAEDLAAHGATVVVNDCGADGKLADAVVARIQARGGQAVADTTRVGEPGSGADLVARVWQRFERLDALVNNAGIVRDRSFHKMSAAEFDEVLAVHLLGSAELTRAVWPLLRTQGHGRVVMMTSAASWLGNYGQANYAAAKLGMVGLTRTLAVEGAPMGTAVNAVAPIADTGMARGAFGDRLQGYEPRLVAPLVTYLCSPACTVNGAVFTAGGGRFARVTFAETAGAHLGEGFDAHDVAQAMPELMRLEGVTFPQSLDEELALHGGVRTAV